MSQKIRFGYQDDGLLPGMDKIRKKADDMDAEWRKNAKSVQEVERAAKRGFQNALPPLEQYNRRMANLKRLLQEGKISQDQFEGATLQAQQALDKQGSRGTAALASIGRQMTGLAASTLSVSAAIGGVVRGYETWRKNAREAAEESRKAAGELASFLALQEGGVAAQRAQRVQQTAIQFGVTDRGLAFDTAQAMQSIRGDFEQGMKATREVFAASLVGIPVELGRELEVFGATAQAKAGEYLRLAFAGGQLSGRDPEALARAAPAVGFFSDARTGFAAASQIAGSVREEQIETFTKASGIALGQSSSAQKEFAKAGLETANEIERLRHLQEKGITTPAELKAFGISEIRQQQAVAALVPLVDTMESVRRQLGTAAGDTGLLARERRQIEAQSPQSILDLANRQAQATFAEAQAADVSSLRQEVLERTRAAAFQRRGLTQEGPFDIIEDGRVSGLDVRQAAIWQALTFQDRGARAQQYREALKETSEQMRVIDEQLSETRSQTELLRDIARSLTETEQNRYRERRQRATTSDDWTGGAAGRSGW